MTSITSCLRMSDFPLQRLRFVEYPTKSHCPTPIGLVPDKVWVRTEMKPPCGRTSYGRHIGEPPQREVLLEIFECSREIGGHDFFNKSILIEDFECGAAGQPSYYHQIIVVIVLAACVVQFGFLFFLRFRHAFSLGFMAQFAFVEHPM